MRGRDAGVRRYLPLSFQRGEKRVPIKVSIHILLYKADAADQLIRKAAYCCTLVKLCRGKRDFICTFPAVYMFRAAYYKAFADMRGVRRGSGSFIVRENEWRAEGQGGQSGKAGHKRNRE